MRILHCVLAGVLIGVIAKVANVSLIPTPATEVLSIPYHLIVYWVLGVLFRGVLGNGTKTAPSAVFIAFLIVILIGAGDEILQSNVPGRDSSPVDWLLDAIGALFGTTNQFRYEAFAFWIKPSKQEQILHRRDV